MGPPPLPSGWTQHKNADGRPYYYNTLIKKSQWKRPTAPTTAEVARVSSGSARQYPICEEHVSSDEDDDEDEEEPKQDAHKIPTWASSTRLEPSLASQYAQDPDAIFKNPVHKQETIVDLVAIFGEKDQSRRYHRRASSGNWSKDRLLDTEEQSYKRARGFGQ
jgi:hypothetical protein